MKIFNFIITITLFTFITGCFDENVDATDESVSKAVGIWTYTYTASNCKEIYNLQSNNTWSETALDEAQSGTYTFNETANVSGKNELTLRITTDNGLANCTGDSTDGSNSSSTVYATFTGSNTMNWFLNEADANPSFVLTK